MSTVTLASLEALRSELANSKYYLNLRSGYMAPVTLHCSYGDSGETITFYIFDGGNEVSLDGGTATVHGTRRDGANFGPFSCTVNGNAVSFQLQATMTAVEGSAIAEIALSKSGASIGTCNFGILVENAVFPNGVAYDTDPSVYQDILKYVQNLASVTTADYTEKIALEKEARIAGDNANNIAIATQASRIDTYLSTGTAATDSELIDIRNGADGYTYTSAGDAVRSQYSDVSDKLKTAILFYNKNLIPYNRFSTGKYIVPTTGAEGTNSAFSYSSYFPISANTQYTVTVTGPFYFAWYNSSKTYISGQQNNIDGSHTIAYTSPSNAAYIRFSCQTAQLNTLNFCIVNTYDQILSNTTYVNEDNVFGGKTLKFVKRITASNYSTDLASLDDADNNTVYELVFALGSSSIPANCPFTSWNGSNNTLITIGLPGTLQKIQIFTVNQTGVIYTRQTGGGFVWGSWASTGGNLTVSPSDDLIDIFQNNNNIDIYVSGGTYDIIQQYKNHFGNDYFDNYVSYNTSGQLIDAGLLIGRGLKLHFAPNAIFTCNYTGSNSAVTSNFSAFALMGDVTLDGLNLTCNNVRDAIHDDFDTAYNGTTTIKNCKITSSTRCIAGGMHTASNYEIVGNIFDGSTSTGYDISYHNNANANYNKMMIKDNYFGAGVSIRYHGSGTTMSDVLITNNSMSKDVEFRAEASSSTTINVRVTQWNNNKRT